MNSNFKCGLFWLAITAAPVAAAEELGRLFFTPEQRAQLESSQQQDGDTPGNARSPIVNGIVKKHGGGRTIWINEVPQFDGNDVGRAAENLPVVMPGQSQPVKIKVGQKVLTQSSAHGQ